MDTTVMIGYGILGLAIMVAGFIPSFLAMYKKNSNAEKLYKFNAVGILVPGILGFGLSLLFQALGVDKEVWALIILIAIEVIRLAIWGYLMYMAIKDKEI